jgi:anthranilate synthase component 1
MAIELPLKLNLGLSEFITATSNQPKPLIIPLCAEIPLPRISPLDVYPATRKGCGFLLESIDGSERIARYLFIGIEPVARITLGKEVTVQGNPAFVAIARDPEGKNPLNQIRSVLSRFHYVNVKAPRFFGGMVGYFAYDCI